MKHQNGHLQHRNGHPPSTGRNTTKTDTPEPNGLSPSIWTTYHQLGGTNHQYIPATTKVA